MGFEQSCRYKVILVFEGVHNPSGVRNDCVLDPTSVFHVPSTAQGTRGHKFIEGFHTTRRNLVVCCVPETKLRLRPVQGKSFLQGY